MPIAITDDQHALEDAIAAWAARADPVAAVRAGEADETRWHAARRGFAELGVEGIALPAAAGGGGGTVVDLAVGLERAAAELAPGPVLGSALTGLVLAEVGGHDDLAAGLATGRLASGAAVREIDVRLEASRITGVVDVPSEAGQLLLVVRDGAHRRVVLVPDVGDDRLPVDATDLSRPLVRISFAGVPVTALDVAPERVLDLAVTLAAAEAAGIAAWALHTAVDYAKVREQFGNPIGRFQAVKVLCSEMLCRSELAAAVAWDAAAAAHAGEEHSVSAAAAGALALDAAVANAKDCIQVLGGIGFTWEHDAHLYLRRALGLRRFVGGGGVWRSRLAELTLAGCRRTVRVDLSSYPGVDERRTQLRAAAEAVAAVEDAERRHALAESGLLVPHWPKPYGLDASPVEQLVADEELARAGVSRPDLVIAGWAVPTILEHGTAEQIERFVTPTLHGAITWCQLFSEPGAGSDLAALRTRAERVDGGWALHGQKVWTSLAHQADWAICLARTNPAAPKHQGITYFLVDMRSPGIDIRPLREITGDEMFNEVFLDGVVVPDELVVGEIDGGWRLARTTLSHERVAMGGGSSIGDAVEKLIAAVGKQGVRDEPVLADELGGHVADGLAGTVFDARAVLRALAGRVDGAAAGVRKLIGVRHRQAVAEAAFELLGPDGQVQGPELHEFLLSRCLSIAGGTSQILQIMTAERVLGLPR